jgi:hypothetical protein
MSKVELMILMGSLAVSNTAANTKDTNRPRSTVPNHAVICQRSGVETLLSDSQQRIFVVKGGSASAKAAFALEMAAQAGAGIMGGPARLAVPYVADGAAKAAHAGKGLITGHAGIVKCIELDVLSGATASISLLPGNVEIVVPLNEYIPSADAVMRDLRPVLLKVEPSMKDQVRLLAARHIELRPQKSGRLHLGSPAERIEVEVYENVIPASFERLANNVYSIRTTQPLAAGEYALVFRKKATSGRYTTNVALRSGLQFAGQRPEIPAPSSKLADLISPPKRPNPAQESRATNYIAFDFRVLP